MPQKYKSPLKLPISGVANCFIGHRFFAAFFGVNFSFFCQQNLLFGVCGSGERWEHLGSRQSSDLGKKPLYMAPPF